MDKSKLSERDICAKFITPALENANWSQHQIREEVSLTDGRIMVRSRILNPKIKGGMRHISCSIRRNHKSTSAQAF